jgi:nucleoside-diphosphate-sugar epimerase
LRRILVTGASGFIGRALVADLARRGFQVRAASRSPEAVPPVGEEAKSRVERVPSPDLSGKAEWGPLLEGIDAVIHAAAIAHTGGMEETAYEAVNHQAVAALAQAARGKVGRFVFLSSIRAQSGTASAGMLTEKDPPRPNDAYGRAKLAAEEALARLDIPSVILRPVLVVGPHPSGNLATMLRLAARGLPLRFDGFAARRSLVALADVASGVAHVLGDPAHLGATYILSHPEPIAVGAMFAALREGLGLEPRGIVVPPSLLRAILGAAGKSDMKEKLFGDLTASPAKLMATGWTPLVSPRAALAEIGATFRRDGR